MKNYFFLSIIVCLVFSGSNFAQQKTKKWLDKDGNLISEETFEQEWRNGYNSRWDHISNSGQRVAQLTTKYGITHLDYAAFNKLIGTKTKIPIPENAVFLIEFSFKGDFCYEGKARNKWTKKQLKKKIRFMKNPLKKLKESFPNLVYSHFFEKGLLKEKLEEPPYFIDNENILKEVFFKNPAFCGSYALIKPNGNALIINGESRADYIAATYLDPDNWNLFFSNEE